MLHAAWAERHAQQSSFEAVPWDASVKPSWDSRGAYQVEPGGGRKPARFLALEPDASKTSKRVWNLYAMRSHGLRLGGRGVVC